MARSVKFTRSGFDAAIKTATADCLVALFSALPDTALFVPWILDRLKMRPSSQSSDSTVVERDREKKRWLLIVLSQVRFP
jgi:hypothetical protein